MLRHIRVEMLVLSILYVLFGLALLVAAETSLAWFSLGISIVVLVGGGVNLVLYFRAETRRFGALCNLAAGVVTTALGVYTLIRPDAVRLVVPIIFGLLILVDGVVRLGASIRFARQRVDKWWVLTLLSVLSCLLGLALAAHDRLPLLNAIDPILLSGVLLVVEGALNLGCTLYIGLTRKLMEDFVENKKKAPIEPIVIEDAVAVLPEHVESDDETQNDKS